MININIKSTGSIPKIPERAEGGVFDKAHLAVIAEDGPEAIIPLSKPSRAAEVMAQAGLITTAKKATTSAANVAKATANAITKAVSGVGKAKGSGADKLAAAAEASSSIQTLVDFVNGIADALAELETKTIPKLSAGWQEKVRAIVKQAAKVAVVIASEINKAFPFKTKTTGKGKDKTTERVAGKSGTRIGEASDTSGPLGSLIEFIVGIGETMEELTTMTFPTISAEVKANVRILTRQAAELAKIIASEVAAAFTAPIKSEATDATSGSTQLIGDISSVLGSFADITVAGIDKAIDGMKYAATMMPTLSTAMKLMVERLQAGMSAVEVSPEFVTLVDSISTITGGLSSILGSLGQMTIKAIENAIGGATTAANRVPLLAVAVKAMIGALKSSLGAIGTEGLAELQKVLDELAAISAAISSIVTNLAAMTTEQMELATSAGRSLGGGFLAGLTSMYAAIMAEARRISSDAASILGLNPAISAPALAVASGYNRGAPTSQQTIINDQTKVTFLVTANNSGRIDVKSLIAQSEAIKGEATIAARRGSVGG